MTLSRPSRLLVLAPLVFAAGCRQNAAFNYPEGFREFAYVANHASNTVTVLDLVYLRIDRTLPVGAAPVAVVVNPMRDEIYTVNQGGNSITVIDGGVNKVKTTIPVQREPIALAVDPTGHRAFVANAGSNSVIVLDLDTDRPIATVATGERPTGLALTPDGRTLVVASSKSGSLSIYTAAVLPSTAVKSADEAPVSPAGTAPLTLRATFSGCPGASAPVVLHDSSKAFAACTDANQILAVSLSAIPGSWNARQDASLTTDHLLAKLDVGQHPAYLAVKPDNGEIFASNWSSDSISEISAQTNEVESTYPIGSRPAQTLVTGDSSALWVADSGADSLSLYSISDGSRLPFVRTGDGPSALAFSADENLLLVADRRSGDVAIIRTNANPHPAMLTMLPVGTDPVAIAVKAMPAKT